MSRKSTRRITIDEETLALLRELQIERKAAMAEPPAPPLPPAGEQAEVKSIIGHEDDSKGNFRFLVRFTDGTQEWVADEDCNCDEMIGRYLQAQGINTAYLICRVSSRTQAGPTHVSLETQEELLRRSIPGGVQRVRVVRIAASAYRGVPTRLQRIFASANDADVLCFYRVDRLSRNIIAVLNHLENLDERGVRIYARSENLNYQSNKLEFIQHIVNAQREAQTMSQRARDVYNKRCERGDHIGPAPYGFRTQRANPADPKSRLVLGRNAPEQLVILELRRRLREAETAEEIARDLNARGQYCRGKPWSVSRMATLLAQIQHNPLYSTKRRTQ